MEGGKGIGTFKRTAEGHVHVDVSARRSGRATQRGHDDFKLVQGALD